MAEAWLEAGGAAAVVVEDDEEEVLVSAGPSGGRVAGLHRAGSEGRGGS